MLTNDIIQDIICWSPKGTKNIGYGEYFEYLRESNECSNQEELTHHLTNTFVPMLSECAKNIFNTDILEKYRIYVVPSALFSAETLYLDSDPIVVIHQGVFCLLSFSIESDIISNKLHQSAGNSRSSHQLANRFDMLKQHLFHTFLSSPNRLPFFRNWMDDKDLEMEFFYLMASELFIIFHEIAHIELGHIKQGRLKTDSWLENEFQADAKALSYADSPDHLILGAWSFLYWYSIYQGWNTSYSDVHPRAKDRFENILRVYKDTQSNSRLILDSLDADLKTLSAMENTFERGDHKDWWMGEFNDVEQVTLEMHSILDVLL